MAQWEREEISERMAASVPIRAKLGKPLGCQAQFGYQWKDKRLIPDPKEVPIRKLIYELFIEHKRKRTVARILNEKEYRTRNGSKFSYTTFLRLLEDPTAKGAKRANYTKSRGKSKGWDLKPEQDWIFFEVEPIVSEEIWDQCNSILNDQRKEYKKPAKRALHLFSGIVFCTCENKMYVPYNSPKYTCAKCRNKIPITDLEKVFHEQLKSFFFSPAEIIQYLEKADHVIKEKGELLKVLLEDKKKTEQEMDKVYQLYVDDNITKEGFGKRYRPLEERLKQLGDQIPELQGEIDFLKIQYLSRDQILSEAKDLYTRWPQLIPEEKRNIIENITEKIIVGEDEVSIHLCYLPSFYEIMTKGPHNPRVAVPFCHFALIAPKPLPPNYSKKLKTFGDHIRKKGLNKEFHKKRRLKKSGQVKTPFVIGKIISHNHLFTGFQLLLIF